MTSAKCTREFLEGVLGKKTPESKLRLMVTDCLRGYMKFEMEDLSEEAQSLQSRMETDKSLVDEWIREDTERAERGDKSEVLYHIPMYLEMKARVSKHEAESGTEVSVTCTMLTDTDEWLKERYAGWQYDRGEMYPKGCGGKALWRLFTLYYPKPDTPSINDVSYPNFRLSFPFIRLAAKVVAIELADAEAQVTDASFQLERSLASAIEPEFLPTTDEIQAAKKRVLFEPGYKHVALVGRSGSGVSSIFRALTALPGATLIKQNGLPALKISPQVILFCLPRWGSRLASQNQYFQKFQLFAFDAVLLVIDGHFLETDLNILKNCKHLAIPFRLIRTKCDSEILRMRADLEGENPLNINFIGEELYAHFKKQNSPYRSEVKRRLDEANIGGTKFYLINFRSLEGMLTRNASCEGEDSLLLDEEHFIEDLAKLPWLTVLNQSVRGSVI